MDKQVSFDYLLFGGGLRECIGKEFACLEMWLFASKLLQDYYRGLYRIKTWN